MNTRSTRTREAGDTRLLLIIAGCVVTGAAVLAALAGLAVGDGPTTERAEEPVKREAPLAEVIPAVSVPSPEPRVDVAVATGPDFDVDSETKIPGSTVDASFQIDPDADFLAEGQRAWQARDFETAAAYFGAEVSERPERSYTQYMLGLSAWKAGDLDTAVNAMTRSLELNPASVKSAVNLSRIHNEAGSFESALEAADEAVRIDESASSSHFLRARSLYNLGRVDEAIASIETSLSIDDDNGHAHNLLGLIRLQQDDETRALASLQKAAGLEPGTAYVQNNLGVALERSGRTAEALIAYEAAVEADATHDKAVTHVARLRPLVPASEDAVDGAAETVFVAESTEESEPTSELATATAENDVQIADGGGAID